jgi:DNA-binding NarL/FixJ family response regulator
MAVDEIEASAATAKAAIALLIVDDDRATRDLLRLYFSTDSRFAVRGVAANGVEALDLAASAPADAVILDIRMPLASGLDVLRQLRADGNRMTVVLFSSYDDDPVKATAARLGAQVVTKGSVTPRQLAETVAIAVAGRGAS